MRPLRGKNRGLVGMDSGRDGCENDCVAGTAARIVTPRHCLPPHGRIPKLERHHDAPPVVRRRAALFVAASSEVRRMTLALSRWRHVLPLAAVLAFAAPALAQDRPKFEL